jgi:hypothetical protein
VFDVVCSKVAGQIEVVDVVEGGGSSVLEGNFIFQVSRSTAELFTEGQFVCVRELDSIDVKKISSGVTVGPSVKDFSNDENHDINNDSSLGDDPPFLNNRKARSVVIKRSDGGVTFEVFDGVPKSEKFQGVTPYEVFELVYGSSADDIDWAYHLDPGQSARMEVRHGDGEIKGYGNKHYVRWPKKESHPYVWAGTHGRAVPTFITITD